MTPSRDVDEIASALIDGALGPDEAAAARRDPAVMARAAEMQAAREAVRRVPAPDRTRGDDAIAAALAAAELPPLTAPGPYAAPPDVQAGADGRAGVGMPYDGQAGSGRSVPGYDVSGDPGASGGLDAPSGERTVGPRPAPAADGRRVGPAVPPADPSRGASAGHPPGPAARPAGGGQVVPMGPAKRRRWADPRWLGAAAAVVLVLALGGVLATAGSSSDDDSSDEAATAMDSGPSTSGESSQESDGGAGSGTGSAESGGDGSTASPESAPGVAPDESSGAPSSRTEVDLGDVGSAGELADRAGHALADTDRSSTDAEANTDDQAPPADGDESSGSGPLTASEACPDPLASSAGAGPLVLQGRATLAGRPVEVWVHDDGTSRRMVAVTTDGSCALVADRPVSG
jgi:hypothetical protein